jgi:subtilisin family serine protease
VTSVSGMISLIHCNEDVGGFPKDESGLLWTDGSNMSVVTSSPKFGSGCLFNIAGSGRIKKVVGEEFNFLADDFTIEKWFKMDYVDTVTLFNIGSDSNSAGCYGYHCFMTLTYSACNVTFQVIDDGVDIVYDYTDVGASPAYANTWAHICFVKSGTNGYFFLNGVKKITYSGLPETLPDINLNDVSQRYVSLG